MKIKNHVVAVMGAVVLSAAFVSAQQKADKPAKADSGAEKFTGCLEPGADATHFTLVDAEQKGVKGKQTFKVVAASPKVALDFLVTKGVEIKGTLDKGDAKNPPTLTVTDIKWKADYCG